MASSANTRSDLLEREYGSGLTILIFSVIGLIACVLLAYFFRFIPNPGLKSGMESLAILGVLCSLYGGFKGYHSMNAARKVPSNVFPCPYCDYPMEFLAPPTEDFDC